MDLLERLSRIATSGPLVGPIWIAFVFLLLSFMRGPLLRVIFRACRVQDPAVVDHVKARVDAPVQLLFVLLAFMPFSYLIVAPLGPVVVLVTHIVAFALLFHIIIQLVDLALFSWYLQRKQRNVAAVVRVFALSVLYLIAGMLLLEWAVGVSILPLLATSTVLTAVVGLALQDTLKNAFAGLNMSMENSFEQGDWVMFRLDSNEQWYGQIVEIGWRTTKIKTLNNNYAVIPNSKFTNHELINFNKPTAVHARTLELPVASTADADSVTNALVRSALSVDGVLDDPKPDAIPTEIKTDCVVYQLRFWLADCAVREQLTGEVLTKAWQELKEMAALPAK